MLAQIASQVSSRPGRQTGAARGSGCPLQTALPAKARLVLTSCVANSRPGASGGGILGESHKPSGAAPAVSAPGPPAAPTAPTPHAGGGDGGLSDGNHGGSGQGTRGSNFGGGSGDGSRGSGGQQAEPWWVRWALVLLLGWWLRDCLRLGSKDRKEGLSTVGSGLSTGLSTVGSGLSMGLSTVGSGLSMGLSTFGSGRAGRPTSAASSSSSSSSSQKSAGSGWWCYQGLSMSEAITLGCAFLALALCFNRRPNNKGGSSGDGSSRSRRPSRSSRSRN
ncbi:hypothetical protein CHLRE_05g238343v5 [Chlamydomonas reinhardtii]|uniref:Uncharacterized protein n=1 Tax=Chlamydomonas reinhardtii TaxID=3055 RepID=A0A2K3DT06_CHLRE|nr:uncharacterized protein CHLRE_05g238343v5 [Chlamydomonas reinhardtii]PNW83661.1 hypothetical protein CHLRE_05g238343v5 [Chlamydomonas reinhardtii]